ncbi:MAG: hypothetical protein Q4B01_09255 [Eubacteriales bacterium]|nr:hypothetical protein [Eubacteriales bacterium]
METLAYKSYILSKREFMVAAALAGLEMLDLPFSEEDRAEKPLSEDRELNLTLFSLYQKEILRWKGEQSYEVSAEMQQILEELKNADTVLTVYAADTDVPFLCHLGSQTVVTESDGERERNIRLGRMTYEQLREKLIERCFPEVSEKTEKEYIDAPELGRAFLLENADLAVRGRISSEELQRVLKEETVLYAAILSENPRRGEEETQNVLLFLAEHGKRSAILFDGKVFQILECTPELIRHFAKKEEGK